jgi:hypothetical protein
VEVKGIAEDLWGLALALLVVDLGGACKVFEEDGTGKEDFRDEGFPTISHFSRLVFHLRTWWHRRHWL